MITKLLGSFFAVSLLSLVVVGCGADASSSETGDDVAVDEAEEAITGAPSNHGYFIVTRRDFRKCAAPMCGGLFVKRVNATLTTCADGTSQAECYVASIKLTGIGLSPREEEAFRVAVEGGKALIKARTYRTNYGGNILGTLKANEGWLGATGSALDGTFFRVASNGIVCKTAPCPSLTAYTLNSSDEHNLIKVGLENTEIPASPDALSRANEALGTTEGILLAGGIALPKCPTPNANCGPFASASEFYLRVQRREGQACGFHGPGGGAPCGEGQFCKWALGDICGAADAPGKCSYKPEVCNKIYRPVCGCDGKTYGNECMANFNETSAASDGACPTP